MEFPKAHTERSLPTGGRWRRPRESAAPGPLHGAGRGKRVSDRGPSAAWPRRFPTLPTGSQAPRVSTFGFPERIKNVTQHSPAAPAHRAAAGPATPELQASGPRHRRPRPRNTPVGGTTGSGLLAESSPQGTPNWRTLSGLPELPSTRILR